VSAPRGGRVRAATALAAAQHHRLGCLCLNFALAAGTGMSTQHCLHHRLIVSKIPLSFRATSSGHSEKRLTEISGQI
jgi:hypothetical protein